MAFFMALIAVSLNSAVQASTPLKTGDVLLLPVQCHLCQMIEAEEHTPYAHAGVVLIENQQPQILEAWDRVSKTPLANFLRRRKKNSHALLLRPITSQGAEVRIKHEALSALYDSEFKGHSYDRDFLWDNRDARGETLYCSELVAKLLNPFLPRPIPTKPMHYDQYREQWIQYFHGAPPTGKPGLSPGDFERSPLFKKKTYFEDESALI